MFSSEGESHTHTHTPFMLRLLCVVVVFPHLVPRSRPKATPSVWIHTIERDIFPALCYCKLVIYLVILKPAQLTHGFVQNYPQHSSFLHTECSPNVPIFGSCLVILGNILSMVFSNQKLTFISVLLICLYILITQHSFRWNLLKSKLTTLWFTCTYIVLLSTEANSNRNTWTSDPFPLQNACWSFYYFSQK